MVTLLVYFCEIFQRFFVDFTDQIYNTQFQKQIAIKNEPVGVLEIDDSNIKFGDLKMLIEKRENNS